MAPCHAVGTMARRSPATAATIFATPPPGKPTPAR